MEEDPWAEYARLQAMLDRTTDAYKAAGIEDAMSDLLVKIGSGERCKSKQVQNLVINRIGKERRRRAIIHAGRHEIGFSQSAEGPAESRLVLAQCKRVVGKRDFMLLVWRAQGRTFGEMAEATGVNTNTLKTWVHRARSQVAALAA